MSKNSATHHLICKDVIMRRGYKDLYAWKKAVDLVENIYAITAFLPREELYGLVSQIRRSAVSVPSNIAEGSSRASSKEFLRFLNIASSSCAELDTQLEIVRRMGWVPDIEITQSMLNEVAAIIIGLSHAIKIKCDDEN